MSESDIYMSVRKDLMRYATALVGTDTADDVVSLVVIRALARPGGLTGLRDAKQYLMKSVLNEARSRHRRHTRQPVVHTDVSTTPASSNGDHVVDVIASLPARQRAAAYLVFYEEYTPSEAAAVMGCRPGTVRRYLHLARTKLREALDG
ncbi:MAG TPA: RNA polymerase sigma factor [Acidimicrobiia bacterium]|nr:RNA polymerase sigma factor [Acidimicrobiia bacterium]